MGERKLTILTHKQKRDICRHKLKNPSLTNRELRSWVQETLGVKVHEATISRLLSKSFVLLSNQTGDAVKRSKTPQCPQVEAALYKWFQMAQETHLPISDELIREKGKALHASLSRNTETSDSKDCKFSSGWLTGFKKRHNISLQVLHGKQESVKITETTEA